MALNSAASVRSEPARNGSEAAGSPASRFPVEEFKRAMETGDNDGVLRLCTDDFVFAPLGTNKKIYQGYDRVSYLLTALMTSTETFNYTGELYTSHDTVALPLRATYAGGKLEINAIDVLKINEEGKATEMRVFARTYMPVTVLAGRTGLVLLRMAGLFWWLPFRIFLWPLEWSQRVGEPIGVGWSKLAMNWALKRERRRQKGRQV